MALTQQLKTLNLSGGNVSIALGAITNLAGLNVSGNITFTPSGTGTAVGTVSGTMPGILGGGQASVTVTTQFGQGVTKIVATAAAGTTPTLGNIFGLTGLTMTYSGGTWTVNATATGAGGSAQTLDGTLTYAANGDLTVGTLSLSNVVLAGILELKTFKITCASATGCSGSAQLAHGGQQAAVSLSFNNQGQITAGSITASGIELWQVFQLRTFSMSYQQGGNAWSLALSIAGAGGKKAPAVDASLDVKDGTVTGANLTFRNVSLLGEVTINQLTLTYQGGAHDIFSGSASVELPATTVSGVDGAFTMTDGLFTSGKLVLHGKVPLYGALTLNTLGAQIDLLPSEVITGYVGLSAGPKTKNGELLGLDNGKLSYAFPASSGGSGTYTSSGDLAALGKTLAQAKMVADSSHVTITGTLGQGGKGFTVGGFTATGAIHGGIVRHNFSLRGHVHFDLKVGGHTYSLSGQLAANNTGLTACGTIPAPAKGSSGISYVWGEKVQVERGDCAPGKFTHS